MITYIYIYIRLGHGAFAQANPIIPKSLINIDVTAAITSGLSNTSEELTNKNIIVPTRLRPTDKRIRKIHSINSSHTTHEKSINLN